MQNSLPFIRLVAQGTQKQKARFSDYWMKISKIKWKVRIPSDFTWYWNVTKRNSWTRRGLKQVDGKFMTFLTFIPSHYPKEISEMMVGGFAWNGTNTECTSGQPWLWLSSETDFQPLWIPAPVLPLLTGDFLIFFFPNVQSEPSKSNLWLQFVISSATTEEC